MGPTVSVSAEAALRTLPVDAEGKLLETPAIRSDNGSCYISREFGAVLDEHELSHKRIKPHCPEENGLMERANRTIGEALEGEELTDYLQAAKVISRLIRWYNEERLHSALGFLRPADYYRGEPETGCTPCGGRSWPRPGIAAERGTYSCGSRRCHLPARRPLLNPARGFVPNPMKQNTISDSVHQQARTDPGHDHLILERLARKGGLAGEAPTHAASPRTPTDWLREISRRIPPPWS